MENNLRLHIRNLLRKNLFEDNYVQHFEKIKSGVANTLAKKNQEELFQKPVARILDALHKQLGIKFSKFLGSGNFGVAFLTDDGKTIKITSDKSEAIEANRYIGKEVQHLPKVYKIMKIKLTNNDDAYVIIKEFILQNEQFVKFLTSMCQDFTDELKKYNHYFDNDFPKHILKYIYEASINNLNNKDFVDYLKLNNQPNLVWLANQLVELINEMQSLNMQSDDIKPNNLGIKNKKLIYLDIGWGDMDGGGWVEKQPYAAEVNEWNLFST